MTNRSESAKSTSTQDTLLVTNVDRQETYYSTKCQHLLVYSRYAVNVPTYQRPLELAYRSRDEQIELLMVARETHKFDAEPRTDTKEWEWFTGRKQVPFGRSDNRAVICVKQRAYDVYGPEQADE